MRERETNGSGILLQLVAEEARLVSELNAVRAAMQAYKTHQPKEAVPAETSLEGKPPTIAGTIREALRGNGPMRSPQIYAYVKRRLPKTSRGTIDTTCGIMCKRGELKRVSKGEYRWAGKA